MTKAPTVKHEDEPEFPQHIEVQSPPPPAASRPMTFGQKAVGLTFNPSGDPTVHELKTLYAQIIDICERERSKIMERRIASQPNEAARLWTIAITQAQDAQMWSVKAATWID
jgi:hypothetical protein